MANSTVSSAYPSLPPLPSYTLIPRPPLLPPFSDKILTVIGPIVAYWAFSLFFHWIDVMDYFPQYRLHTPEEVLKRNRVSRWDVFRDVIIQQVVQIIVGTILTMTEPDDFLGKKEYDITVWARRIRIAQRAIPTLASLLGVDAIGLSKNIGTSHSTLARLLSGGRYPVLQDMMSPVGNGTAALSAFASWEITFSKVIYHLLIPIIQFAIGIVVIDTWQYFLHRAMHMNKWLYTTFHSRHHRLYVPYAYGALYNHPFEGFLLDILGASIAYKAAGMTTLQGLALFVGSTFKTVDDHCGYALPWDPLQHITSNNAGYHDVHHQTWGIKANFSQPFFTFWDRVLGTKWTGGDVSARYEKSRIAAQKAIQANKVGSITGSDPKESKVQSPEPYQNDLVDAKDLSKVPKKHQKPSPPLGKAELQAAGSRQQVLDDEKAGGPSVLMQESREEKEAQASNWRSTRRRATSSSTRESLRGLSQKVTGNTCISSIGS